MKNPKFFKQYLTFLLLSFFGLSVGMLSGVEASAQGTLNNGLVARYYFNGNAYTTGSFYETVDFDINSLYLSDKLIPNNYASI